MKPQIFVLGSMLLATSLLVAGCPSANNSASSPSSNSGPTDSPTPSGTPTSTPNATATFQAAETATALAIAVATHDARATATAQQNATVAVGASQTATGQPTATATPSVTSTSTRTATPYPTTTWMSFFGYVGQQTGGANPAGSNGNFEDPLGVAVGGGYLAVADHAYGNIQVFNSSGSYLYSVTPQGASPVLFGMTMDSNGELYVADYGDTEVDGYQLGASTYTYDYSWSGQGQVAGPFCVKIDAKGNLVVGDIGTDSVWNLAWADDSVLNQTPIGAVANMAPYDLALDASGNIYVSDEANDQVEEFNQQYTYTGFTFNGSGWTTPLGAPNGIGVDSQGNLFVSDPGNARVVYATPQGNYLGEIDGFVHPTFLALDGSDDLFVTDTQAYQVDEFTR